MLEEFFRMAMRSFNRSDLNTVSDALDIAEDLTGNYYKLSHRQWRRHRYDVKTLPLLSFEEITDGVFASLNKGIVAARDACGSLSRTEYQYIICVQDHQVLNALDRDKGISLLPLMVYVFTHELIHIVRFSNFVYRFEAPDFKREEEEKAVHRITHDILKRVPLPKLGQVLAAYDGHRVCDLFNLSH